MTLMFPCKSCGHFHWGKKGESLQFGDTAIEIVVDEGCFELECHCGKITPSEMLR